MPANSAPGALERDFWPWPLGSYIIASHQADPFAVFLTVEAAHPLHCEKPCPLCGGAAASVDDAGGATK